MAKKGLVGFEAALPVLKAGKRVNREDWMDEFAYVIIEETGLGDSSKMFIRMGKDKRPQRYPLTTADILAPDWMIL